MVLNKNKTPKLSNNNNSKKHTGFRLKKYKKGGTFRKNRVTNLREKTIKISKGGADTKRSRANNPRPRGKKKIQQVVDLGAIFHMPLISWYILV